MKATWKALKPHMVHPHLEVSIMGSTCDSRLITLPAPRKNMSSLHGCFLLSDDVETTCLVEIPTMWALHAWWTKFLVHRIGIIYPPRMKHGRWKWWFPNWTSSSWVPFSGEPSQNFGKKVSKYPMNWRCFDHPTIPTASLRSKNSGGLAGSLLPFWSTITSKGEGAGMFLEKLPGNWGGRWFRGMRGMCVLFLLLTFFTRVFFSLFFWMSFFVWGGGNIFSPMVLGILAFRRLNRQTEASSSFWHGMLGKGGLTWDQDICPSSLHHTKTICCLKRLVVKW